MNQSNYIRKNRALRGELEEAIDIGIKVLKISGALHLNKLMFIIVPSLTQIMVLFPRINILFIINFLNNIIYFLNKFRKRSKIYCAKKLHEVIYESPVHFRGILLTNSFLDLLYRLRCV